MDPEANFLFLFVEPIEGVITYLTGKPVEESRNVDELLSMISARRMLKNWEKVASSEYSRLFFMLIVQLFAALFTRYQNMLRSGLGLGKEEALDYVTTVFRALNTKSGGALNRFLDIKNTDDLEAAAAKLGVKEAVLNRFMPTIRQRFLAWAAQQEIQRSQAAKEMMRFLAAQQEMMRDKLLRG